MGPQSRARGLRPPGRGWRRLLLLALAAPRARALYKVVDVAVTGTTEQLTLLEAGMSTNDDEEMFAEITTWVPECKWYQKLPCSCEHVLFHTPEGNFVPGFDKLWHKPTLERLLTQQFKYLQGSTRGGAPPTEPYFWHNGGMGGLKNSLDVSFFIVGAHADNFQEFCGANVQCDLSRRFSYVLNWLISTMSFSVFDKEKHIAQYQGFFDWLSRPAVIEAWRTAPWHFLLKRPQWAAAFLYVIDQLEGLLADDNQGPTPASADLLGRFRRVRERLGGRRGSSERCFVAGGWWAGGAAPGAAAVAALAEGGRQAAQGATEMEVLGALRVAFDEACELPPIHRLVLFGQAIRPLLPELPEHEVWPSTAERATPLEGNAVYRLCGPTGVIVHRRTGHAELHFLAADVSRVAGELSLELLWFASSDDRCIMAGTTDQGPHGGKVYYSFLHTLPAAHLVHWKCGVSVPGESPETPMAHAVTLSFSGFVSVTTCRIPKGVAASLANALGNDPVRTGTTAIELTLSPPKSAGGWEPEALRICVQPRPRRLLISACSAPLHNAKRMHSLAPFLIEDWLNYHLLIGVQHFTLYDSDGSYAPYLQPYVDKGLVSYYGSWPSVLLPKVGLLAEGVAPAERRPMLTEPQALDTCVWANRHVSDWVLVLHSFEEYLHSPKFAASWDARDAAAASPLAALLEQWAGEVPGGRSRVAVFELFQEPMGGPKVRRAKSVLSTWTRKRGDLLLGKTGQNLKIAAETHSRPFAWIVDPLNVMHTAVHLAQPRAHGQAILALPPESLRVNHYIDLGSNKSRCLHELGGCEELDEGMLWAEAALLRMRRRKASR